MSEQSGSLVFLGASRFQGFWNADTNEGKGSNVDNGPQGTFSNLFSTGSSPAGGYYPGTNLYAKNGDYWQVSGSGNLNLDGDTNWRHGDWIIYSASVGTSNGEWVRLSYDDTIASVAIGDISSTRMFHLGNNNKHILFVTGTTEQTSAHTGSSNFTYDYDTDTLLITGAIGVSGNISASADVSASRLKLGGRIQYEETNTSIVIDEDSISFSPSGSALLSLQSGVSKQITLNSEESDVDFALYKSLSSTPSLMVSGSDGVVHSNYGIVAHDDLRLRDDKKVLYGNDDDAYVEYNSASDSLVISGTSAVSGGLILRGQQTIVDNKLVVNSNLIYDSGNNLNISFDGSGNVNFANDATIVENKKLYFGSSDNSSIELYRTGTTEKLIISGSTENGIELIGPALTVANETISSGTMANTSSYVALDANGKFVLTTVAAGFGGEGDITAVYAGTGLSGGATVGPATLSLDLAAVIDSDSNNRLLTTDGDGTLTAEANVTYDGSTFVIADNTTITGTLRVVSNLAYIGNSDNNSTTFLTFQGSDGNGYIAWNPVDDQFKFYDDVSILDDRKIYLGSSNDSYIGYDEAGADFMVISGSSAGLSLSGSTISLDGNVDVSSGIRHKDDTDTYLRFDNNSWTLAAGGSEALKFTGTSQRIIMQPAGSVHVRSNLRMYDDDRLEFGNSADAYIEYDANGTDALIVSGTTSGVKVRGPLTDIDGTLKLGGNIIADSSGTPSLYFDGSTNASFGGDVLLAEDKKLYFGTNSDAHIEFDDNGTGQLQISGSATGMQLHGSQILLNSSDVQITGSVDISGSLIADTITARQYKVEAITKTVIMATGSTNFGDSMDDTHDFMGTVYMTGALGINTRNVTHGLTLPNTGINNAGAIKAYSLEAYSSERFKDNIQTLENPLDKLMKLRGVSFDWRDTGKRDIGFIAEEVGEVLPEVVSYDAEGKNIDSMSYQKMTSLLLECVKEQQIEMAKMKHALQSLKEKEK